MATLLLPLGAVLAGVISFSSPCCLPLIPGYLSYVSALPVSELGQREARAVTLRAALLFVAGFTLVFAALGDSAARGVAVLLSIEGEMIEARVARPRSPGCFRINLVQVADYRLHRGPEAV